MSNVSKELMSALWRNFGGRTHPAEWDGNIYGGGKLSQRFWEYLKAIELLELTSDSVVLDIGGGSPSATAPFFANLLAAHVKEVLVMDPNLRGRKAGAPNVTFHGKPANYETLSSLLKRRPGITHISCISVLEHVPHAVRRGMVKAINDAFTGGVFVATLEFHARNCFFDSQLTTRTLSKTFKPLRKFYPDTIQRSPFWSEDAFSCYDIEGDKGPVVPFGIPSRLGFGG